MEEELTTFVNMVRKMRKAQKVYFKTRDYNAMVESKFFEGKVDKFIKDHDEKKAYNNQSSLFEDKLPF